MNESEGLLFCFFIAKHGVEYPVLQDVLCNSKIRLQ